MTHEAITELLDAARLGSMLTTRGGRIVAQVSRPDAAGTSYRTELVEIDGYGRTSTAEVVEDESGDGADGTARVGDLIPLTRGDASVGSAAPAEDGTTFFTAKRTGEDGKEADDAQLWALPPRGEARELAARPGGFGTLHAGQGRLVVELEAHSQATTEAEHTELTKTRTEAGVTAALHSEFPTRHWNQDLGPTRTVLAVADLPGDLAWATPAPDPHGHTGDEGEGGRGGTEAREETVTAGRGASAATDPLGPPAGDARRQLLHFRYAAMPPGRLTSWTADRAGIRALAAMTDSHDDALGVSRVYLLDLTGEHPPRLVLDATAEVEYSPGEFSPEGTRALVGRERLWTRRASLSSRTQVLDLATGGTTDLWPDHDHWLTPTWLDEATVVAVSDDQGRGSLWIGGTADAQPRRLAGGPEQDVAFAPPAVAAGWVVTSASGIATAPHPILVDPGTGVVTELPNPAETIDRAGTLTEVAATAADGTPLRAWLRLPEGEGPHPLVVFAHGGPWGSWNAWTFRWNPNPFVATGYAVLMPDPAISTGYGQSMIDRGQHELGGAPFADIMALTDAAVARADIDADLTAFAGGSYGGYMANWVAGHTGDRFRCVVTHASLWDTESMGHTTDNAGWEDSMREQNEHFNPRDAVSRIVVPMLVIHGDKDYRVPIAQAHALWYDLNAFSRTPRDEGGRTRHRYLYFPDEGHWITGRGNAEAWYSTFLAFLDEHVRGMRPERPATLG